MKIKLTILIVVAVATLTGCDSFFGIHTVVTDAATGQPLAGATAILVANNGPAAGVLKCSWTTGTNGVLNHYINEHSSGWATLTIRKPGYETWSTQFKGSPRVGFVVRLKPKDENESNQLREDTPRKLADPHH